MLSLCTIASKNYLGYVRTLVNSFKENHPESEAYVLLVDKIDNYFDPEKENFVTFEMDQIGIPDFDSFCFKYDVLELNTAVKPFFMEYLLENYSIDKLIYCDPDILINKKLNVIDKLLEENALVLTPHILSPYPDFKNPNEITLLQVGSYNLGFIGVSKKEVTIAFLKWWQERLYNYCVVKLEGGLFVDQKWVDLVPSLFNKVYILREPEYNVAYWNLHERDLVKCEKGFNVNKRELGFFHFSGFDYELNSISKHQNRYQFKDFIYLEILFSEYKDKLIDNKHLESKKWPYFYSVFNNGVKIPDIVRKIYNDKESFSEKYKNPYETSRVSFYSWLIKPVSNKTRVTNFLYEIYKRRSDLQKIFPDPLVKNENAFLRWAFSSIKDEYNADEVFHGDINLIDIFDTPALDEEKYNILNLEGEVFVTELYRTILGREPDINGLKHYTNLLDKGVPKRIVMWRFLSSKESKIKRSYKNKRFSIKKKDRIVDIIHKDSRKNFGLNISGYIDTESGVGEAARLLINSTKSSKIPYVIENVEQEWLRRMDNTFTDFTKEKPYYFNILCVNADQTKYVIDALGGRNYTNNHYNIGYWFWELSEFPEKWSESFNELDEVWTATDFGVSSISRKTRKAVTKIPLSIEIKPINKYNRDYFGIPNDKFAFLFMFDFMSSINRKNPIAILHAFKKFVTNRENKDVVLVIKVSNSDKNIEAYRNLKDECEDLPVVIIDKYLLREQINDLLDLCDSYISLHRSEGFGLTMAESMYLGKPVIATGYSGNTEFMNVNNSLLVGYELIQVNEDRFYSENGEYLWANPDIEHAAYQMKKIYHNNQLREKIAFNAKEYIKRYHNPKHCGKEIEKRLNVIQNN